MRFSRSVPLIVAIWLALVTVGSNVVWGVISDAGQAVVTAQTPIGVALMPAASGAETTRTAGPSHGPSASPKGSPDTAAATVPRPASLPASDDAAPAASAPTFRLALPDALPPVSRSGPDRPSSQTPGVALRAVRSATWEGLGGFVTAQCVGAAISLVDAQAADGYALEVLDPGPDLVVVQLDGVELVGISESEVSAECVSGIPSFLAASY